MEAAGDGYGGDRRLSRADWGIVLIAGVLVALGAFRPTLLDTANSRLATAISLVDAGTWQIDVPVAGASNPFEPGTVDKVTVDGHLISSKPPILPLMMAGEYWVLHRLGGLSLSDATDVGPIVMVMTLSLIGLPFIAGLVAFAKILSLFYPGSWRRSVPLLALALGTQLLGYGTNINNHGPASGLLLVALYQVIALFSDTAPPKTRRFVLFGLTGALVATMDIPAAIFIAFAGLVLLVRYPRQTLVYLIPAAVLPLAVHFVAMYVSSGSLLPVQMRKELYLAEGAYWRHPRGLDALSEPKGTYLFHMMYGRYGSFLLFPILNLGLLGGAAACFWKRYPMRVAALLGLLGFLLLTVYYVRGTNNYGGHSYGFRWHIVSMPVLMLLGAPIVMHLRRSWQWVVVALMLGVSVYSAYECYKKPWALDAEWTVRYLYGTAY